MSPCAAPGLVSGRALGGRPGGRRERPPHRVHPHFLAHLAADMAQALDAVDAHGLEAAVAQHAHHLRVLCAGAQSASLAPLRAASCARNGAVSQRNAPWPSSLKMSSRFSSLSFLPAAASALVAGRIPAALEACTARQPQRPHRQHRDSPRRLFLPPCPARRPRQHVSATRGLRDQTHTVVVDTHPCSSAWQLVISRRLPALLVSDGPPALNSLQ